MSEKKTQKISNPDDMKSWLSACNFHFIGVKKKKKKNFKHFVRTKLSKISYRKGRQYTAITIRVLFQVDQIKRSICVLKTGREHTGQIYYLKFIPFFLGDASSVRPLVSFSFFQNIIRFWILNLLSSSIDIRSARAPTFAIENRIKFSGSY